MTALAVPAGSIALPQQYDGTGTEPMQHVTFQFGYAYRQYRITFTRSRPGQCFMLGDAGIGLVYAATRQAAARQGACYMPLPATPEDAAHRGLFLVTDTCDTTRAGTGQQAPHYDRLTVCIPHGTYRPGGMRRQELLRDLGCELVDRGVLWYQRVS